MESNVAEITGQSDGAKVDSDAAKGVTDGSAPSGTETAAAEAESNRSPEKKRDEGQERFDKLTRDLYELRGELDRGRYEREQRDRELAELRAKLAETAKQSQVAPDSPPTLEQFGYDEAKYQAALYSHLTKTVGAKLRDEILGEVKQTETQRRQQETLSAWQKRQAEFAKTNPDYVEKVVNAATIPISKELQEKLMQLEDGPQIALHLADNREKAYEIMRLPIEFQLMEVGSIRASLKKSPPVSKAPPPPSKVDHTDEVTVSLRPDAPEGDRLSMDEWLKRREKQLRPSKKAI